MSFSLDNDSRNGVWPEPCSGLFLSTSPPRFSSRPPDRMVLVFPFPEASPLPVHDSAGGTWLLALPIEADVNLPFCCEALVSIYCYNNSISLMEMRCQNAPGFCALPSVTREALAEHRLPKSAHPLAMAYFSSLPPETARARKA